MQRILHSILDGRLRIQIDRIGLRDPYLHFSRLPVVPCEVGYERERIITGIGAQRHEILKYAGSSGHAEFLILSDTGFVIA